MKKTLHLFSNGSINFIFSKFSSGKEVVVHLKDYNNLFLNKKNKVLFIKSSTFLTEYKQRYLK